MLPSGMPAALRATPASGPSSTNVPFFWFDPQLVRRRVVGDVEVQPSVAVVVAGRDAEPCAIGFRDAGGVADVR